MALPETLQVRMAPLFARRVRAGAPVPARALDPDELARNLEWFANPGPRGRPVSAVVLSGLVLDTLGPTAAAVAASRARSVRRVVVHADASDVGAILASPLAAQIEVLAVAVRSAVECASLPACEVELHLVVPLEHEVLPELPAIAAAAVRLGPRLTWTWPFPTSDAAPPPPPPEAVARAIVPLPPDGPAWTVKGLPPCLLVDALPTIVDRVGRSANRWYVDAGHQLDRALLFLPDVVRFAKREGCRFCDLDPRCDGVAEAWLRTGLVPALVPIRGTGGRG